MNRILKAVYTSKTSLYSETTLRYISYLGGPGFKISAQVTSYPDRTFRDLAQFLQANAGIVP
jgi:hypothetical protein